MTGRPIIFSGPMVRALLAGRKTMTRRIVQAGHVYDDLTGEAAGEYEGWRGWRVLPQSDGRICAARVPYAVGDQLYVREAWAPLDALTHSDPGPTALINRGFYRADESTVDGEISRWRSPIHMPRWASRLTLIVTDVRVERLNDISEADAKAEGIVLHDLNWPTCRSNFLDLWNSLHGPDAWAANPWVVVVSFRPILANIDAHPKAGGLQDEKDLSGRVPAPPSPGSRADAPSRCASRPAASIPSRGPSRVHPAPSSARSGE